MRTPTDQESRTAEAANIERRAKYSAKKGNHAVARDLYCRAAELFLEAGYAFRAADCFSEAQTQAAWVWQPGPVNVSGLVD